MKLEDKLGLIAMKFRGKHNPWDREEAKQEYAQVVFELIESGLWNEMPSFEDMLPNEYMPEAFFEYWGIKRWSRN